MIELIEQAAASAANIPDVPRLLLDLARTGFEAMRQARAECTRSDFEIERALRQRERESARAIVVPAPDASADRVLH